MKVLFVISDTGLGHRAAMEGLLDEFKLKLGPELDYTIIDLLELADVVVARDFPLLHTKISQGGIMLAGYNFIFWLTKTRIGFFFSTLFLRIHLWMKQKIIVDYFKQQDPDLVVNINAYTNVVIQWSKLKKKFKFKYCNVITDLTNIHYSWILGKHDLCVVANNMALQNLVKHKVSNVEILGYPLKRKFYKIRNNGQMHIEQTENCLHILLFGRHIQQTVKTITCLLATEYTLEIKVICGKNTVLKEQLEQQFPGIDVYGFSGDVHKMMATSDIIISKAGPGIIMEAIYLQKPLILTHYIGNQEKQNIDFVVDNQYGFYCPDEKSLQTVIKAITSHKPILSPNQFHYQYNTGKMVDRIISL